MGSLKKLHAFTLAEVLVTLMIIGVVAAMTIPGLRRSTEEKESIVAMKKAYSVISQAVSLAENENGPLKRWTFGGAPNLFYNEYFKPYLNISMDCGLNEACFGEGIKQPSGTAYGAGLYKIVLADGSRWMIEAIENNHTHIFVDVNGAKKPNRLGTDVFAFTVAKAAFADYAHNVPEAGVYYFGQGITRANMLANCTTNGYTCGAMIVLDGDKIKY